ncbi:MAG: hypothetical protein JWQ40_4079 [Segetibacter sp.]|nr:hypothetical protein [Segetibacter sp.]
MELQELKDIWNQSDQQAERQFRINFDSLKKISIEKAKSILWPLQFNAIVETLVNALFLPPVLRFLVGYSSQPKFLIPALLLALMLLFTIAWNIYSIVLLATIDYQSPIVQTQKKLSNFNYRNSFRQQRLLYILYPVAQSCFLIMFCKAVPGIDLYDHPQFLVLQFVIGFVLVPVMIWIIKLSPDKTIAGALSFLNDIKRFEKED